MNRKSDRRLAPRLALATMLAGLLVLAACSGGGYTYVGTPDRRAFFKVPNNWTAFHKREILVRTGQDLSRLSNEALPFLMAFDSHPDEPSLEHVLSLEEAPEYPVVYARTQVLTFGARDTMSLQKLRNSVYAVDELAQDDRSEILSYEELVLPGGMRGNRILFDVILRGVGGIAPQNPVIRVNQTAILDPSTRNFYLFVVRCEVRCYEANKSLIDQVVRSWTVKER